MCVYGYFNYSECFEISKSSLYYICTQKRVLKRKNQVFNKIFYCIGYVSNELHCYRM